ncbi:sulfite exporter TauE/SafE family protein [soil metagenome]
MAAELLAIPFGLAIGLIVGTVGGGGAILALPVLIYVLGEPAGPAATASLIVVALGASVGAGAQAISGYVCWRVALVFSAPAAVGAYLGTVVGAEVSERVLVLSFVPVMLAAAALTYLRGSTPEPDDAEECPPRVGTQAVFSGLAVGAMTGFFGVGGGFLIVPALSLLLGMGLRRSIAKSLAIITLTGLVALGSHLAQGNPPDWDLTLALSGSAAVGALAGTRLGRRIEVSWLANGFAAVVAALAVFLLIDVVFLGGPPG